MTAWRCLTSCRFLNARETVHERRRDDLTGSADLARPCSLDKDGGSLRRSDRACTSLVDVTRRHFRGGVAGDVGTDARNKILPANAEAPDLCPSICTLARHMGVHRIFGLLHAVDGDVLDRRLRSKARTQVRG